MEDFLASFAFGLLIAGQFSAIIAARDIPDPPAWLKSREGTCSKPMPLARAELESCQLNPEKRAMQFL